METKALFNPETDVLRISKRNYESKNSFLATIILKKFGTLTLSSLGFTSEKVIKTASKLEQICNNNLNRKRRDREQKRTPNRNLRGQAPENQGIR